MGIPPAASTPEDTKLLSESMSDGQRRGELPCGGEDTQHKGFKVLSPGTKSGGRYMARPHGAQQQTLNRRHGLGWPEAVVTLRLGA